MGAGKIKFRQKQYAEALVHFKEALRLEPLKAQPYMRSARIYAMQKEPDKALEQLRNVVKLNPKSAVGYAGIGQVLQSQEKHEEAAQTLNKAVMLNPQFLKAHQGLALSYARLGKFPEAISQLKTALRINPQDSDSYAGLGRVYLEQKDYSGAREAYQQAINLNPEARASVRMRYAEVLIADNRPQEAADVLKEMPAKEQLGAKLHILWGDIYQRQGLFKEAAQEYQAANLLAAEGEVNLDDELNSLDILSDEEDDKWEELAAGYRATAAKVGARRPITSTN
jgi:predicted Zn-dependent protease